ncbi:MAG: AraC family transcriptional regulator [Saccharospirillaceae bacterium]|nr:AraC family transcriptional regulator [Saccharospirillaceae bacterium]
MHVQNELNVFSILIGWNIYLPASYGALLYLYCRQAITDRPLVWKDALHLLPVLSCYLLNVDILFASAETKFNWTTAASDGPISLSLAQIITYVQAFVYLGFSFYMVRRYQQQAKQNLSDFNPEIFRWIWVLLILTLSVWSFKSVSSSETLYFLSITSDIIIIFLIYGVALAQWRNPRLFTINKIEAIVTLQNVSKETESKPEQDKHNSGALDVSTRDCILKDVKQYMENEHAYKDNQLNLISLSELVGVSTHHLSEVLNQHEGKNFYQFVNDYRVNYVCEHLIKGSKPKIIELALDAGFSSKSTFNAVFKQFTGLSPTQYRQKVQNT